jgi:beta-glucosidase
MHKGLLLSILFLLTLGLNAQQNMDQEQINKDIDQLLAQLTVEEKVSLLSGRDDWSTKPIDRLNIPWIWLADGPHGLRRAPATNQAGYGDQHPATCFPTASALAATWDLDLVENVGKHLGMEAQALGVNVLLGPGVNIKRSPLGGRNFEYFSEDPILAGEMGAAFIRGVQSQGVGTSLKHFTANNVETARMFMNSDVDSRTLHEIYLRPFEIAVKKADPWTIMACYNRVQGEYGTQNPYLLQKILREDWAYDGVIVSDWFAVVDKLKSVQNGLNLEMPHANRVNDQILLEGVKKGKIDGKVLDERVRQILKLVFKAKAQEQKDAAFDEKKHHAYARKVAAEAITLLKNEDKVLPIHPNKYKKIAIIGEFAKAPRFQGNGSSEVKPTLLDNAWDLIQKEYGDRYDLTYAQGYRLEDDDDFTLIGEAKEVAEAADIVVVFAGLPLHYESEGIDRKHIDMPASHNQLIDEVSKVQDKTVVLLTNGSAIAMPWAGQVGAVLETWLGGQAGAGASADVLFGKVNPSGKLAETFPKRLEDTPSFFNFPGEQGEVSYGERIFVGYRYFDGKNIEPLFPFGFGLSYTEFEYKDLQLSSQEIQEGDKIQVSLSVRNTGDVAGKEVVQLYVSDPECTLQRPEKELKAFAKIALEAGEEKRVNFELEVRDLSYYDAKRDSWIAESGTYVVSAASSSRDIRLQKKFDWQATREVPLGFDEYTFFREYWDHQPTRELLKEMMPNWISQFVPSGKSLDEAEFHDFFIDHPMIKFPYISNGEVSHQQIMELVEKVSSWKRIP